MSGASYRCAWEQGKRRLVGHWVEEQCQNDTVQILFFFCWTGIELIVGVTSKKANVPCTEASSYLVPLADTEAMNNYQCDWTRTKVVISWWLKALLQLFKTEKRCNFNGTWTSSVPTEDCVDIPFPFDALNFLLTLCLSLTSFFISIIFFSITWSTAQMGEPIFPPGTCMINVWTCKLYEELALRGVTYGRNSCMMKQEFWFLPKLYNENFLSDGH